MQRQGVYEMVSPNAVGVPKFNLDVSAIGNLEWAGVSVLRNSVVETLFS